MEEEEETEVEVTTEPADKIVWVWMTVVKTPFASVDVTVAATEVVSGTVRVLLMMDVTLEISEVPELELELEAEMEGVDVLEADGAIFVVAPAAEAVPVLGIGVRVEVVDVAEIERSVAEAEEVEEVVVFVEIVDLEAVRNIVSLSDL